jgi:hypothetical protein
MLDFFTRENRAHPSRFALGDVAPHARRFLSAFDRPAGRPRIAGHERANKGFGPPRSAGRSAFAYRTTPSEMGRASRAYMCVSHTRSIRANVPTGSATLSRTVSNPGLARISG